MINPPQGLNGTASAPITIKALNDGKVTLNGQGSSVPIVLYYNNYFVIEGINARDSIASVVSLSNSSHNIIRRVAAWDAADKNTDIFGVHGSTSNLLEDVAGWGIARTVFSASQGGNNTTFRRAWGRWEGSHVVGGKNVFQLAYNAYDVMCENCIGQFSGQRMKQSYVLMDYYGKPWTGTGAGTYTNYSIDQPGQIFHATTGSCPRTKLLGSLAYVLNADRFDGIAAVFVTKLDCITIQDTVAVFQQGFARQKRAFYLDSTLSGANALIANRVTGISEGSYIKSDWKQTSIYQGSTLAAVPNPWTSGNAANLCFRYENGVRTTKPLWPWPMNQRIAEAMIQSGRTSVDVTATIESTLGPISSACKGSSTGPSGVTPPNPPLNLKVSP
jgi:hypothetical protein